MATAGKESPDYSLGEIQNAIVNYAAFAECESISVIIIKCDLDMAYKRLGPADAHVVDTVRSTQGMALLTRQVSGGEWGRATRRLFAILNQEGTG